MPDPLFAELYGDTERLDWDPTDEVRERARRRTRRTRVAAGVACALAVATIATGAVAVAGGPKTGPPLPPATNSPSASPTTMPTPSTAPSTTGEPSTTPSHSATSTPSGQVTPTRTVPASAMLQPDDLPDGFRATVSDLDGDWSLESVTVYCSNRSPSLLVGEVGRRGMEYDSPTERILERVTRHSGDDAVTVMANVRQLVRGCDLLPPDSSISILAEGLGGDDSLLVAAEIDGIPNRWLFVRQGDLVAQLDLEYQTTEADARPYARMVAARLCAGTDAC